MYLDSTDINLKMIEDGFASAYLKYPFSKSKQYKSIFNYIKNSESSGEVKSFESNF